MNVSVISPGAFASVQVDLEPGDSFISESGAMVRMSGSVDVDVTTRPKGSKGGLLGGLKRLLGGDSFFFSTYTTPAPGEVVLAPTLPGDCHVLQLDGSSTWLCAGASYLGSGPGVELDTEFQGFKGMFSGESLVFMEAKGTGPLVVNAFGKIREVEVDGSYVVDTGHVVAYETSLDYSVSKAGSSWFHSWLSGEGFVLRFEGRGRLLIQSHNPSEFGGAVGGMLPTRRA